MKIFKYAPGSFTDDVQQPTNDVEQSADEVEQSAGDVQQSTDTIIIVSMDGQG